MRILVTGAAGLIGRQLILRLLAEEHVVLAVDSFVTSNHEEFHAAFAGREGVLLLEMDVTDAAFEETALTFDPDQIYHLACPTGTSTLRRLAYETLMTCFTGTRNVLEVAVSRQADVVLASSADVYGAARESPQAEAYTGNVDPLGSRSPYEEGKRVAETLCEVYADRWGVNARIARLFSTYGPGMSTCDTRMLPSFIRSAVLRRPIEVLGDGEHRQSHMYVGDAVEGLSRVMKRGRPATAYNLGSPQLVSACAAAEQIASLATPESPVVLLHRPPHDHEERVPNITRARVELGWEPVVPFEAGIRRTFDDFSMRLAGRPVGATGQPK